MKREIKFIFKVIWFFLALLPVFLNTVEEIDVRDHLSYFMGGLRLNHANLSGESEVWTWNQKTWIWILASRVL